METRLKESDPQAKSSLTCGPLSNIHMIDCIIVKGHRSGGLAIVWNDVISINVLNSNKVFMDMYITSCNIVMSWYATGIWVSLHP